MRKTTPQFEPPRELSDANAGEMDALWRKLVRHYHPDRFANEPGKLDADELIGDVKDEIAHALRKEDGPAQRRVLRLFGFKFTPNPGEAPEPQPVPTPVPAPGK